MNYTGDDNVGKRTSEEPGDSGVVGSVIAPATPEEPVAPEPSAKPDSASRRPTR